MAFADDLYAARRAVEVAEDALVKHVLVILGLDPNDPEKWPFDDTTYDEYDYSFELKNVKPGLVFTVEQQQRLWDLGFDQFWLNYSDKTERHCSRLCPQGSLKDASGNFIKEVA